MERQMNSEENQESQSSQSKGQPEKGENESKKRSSDGGSQSSFQRPATKRLKIDAGSHQKSSKTSATLPNMGLEQLLEKDTQYKLTYESQDDQKESKNEDEQMFKFIKIQDSKSEPTSCKLRFDASHKIVQPKPFLKDSNLQRLLQIANIAKSQQNIDILPSNEGKEYDCEIYDTESLMREPIKQIRLANGDSENADVLDIMYCEKYPQGKKVDERFYCNQQMFRSVMPNDVVKFFWILHNTGAEDFLNVTDHSKHFVQSSIFESFAGVQWQIRFQPGDWPNYGPNGKLKNQTTASKLTLFAIPSPEELQLGKIQRQIYVSLQIHNSSENRKLFKASNTQHMNFVQDLKDDPKSIPSQTIEEFYPMISPQNMRLQGFSEQIYIEMDMEHQLFEESSVKEDKQPFKGLINEGTTCYMNSLLQTLYFLRAFRNAVYLMPNSNLQNADKSNHDQIQEQSSNQIGAQDINQQENIPFCLQRIFYNLQLGKMCGEACRTHELLQAFGWTNNERNQQQDVNEFNCILSDQLERQMKNTDLEGTYKNLFEGTSQSVVQCTKISFESSRDEVFNTLQLSVKGNKTIEDSIKQYVEAENLDGDNQYDTEKYGKQDARKFIRFKELPPVLQVSLNRFDYDPNFNRMVKNNQKFEFSEMLDLEAILPKESNESSQTQLHRTLSQKIQSQDQKSQKVEDDKVVNRFHLHSILVHKGTLDFGHYYAFIRPSVTDDNWYEFNDADVKQVTKNYAFKQGCGGDFKIYDLHRGANEDYDGSCATLKLKHIENNTNAYMLIYVRETEREAIMTDKKKLDEQIPKQLQDYFQMEERFRGQIEQDFNAYQNFSKCYLITEDIFKSFQWNNLTISTKFKSTTPNPLKFESNSLSHLLLRIHQDISINEFIQMIKNRFFKDDDEVGLEDIWVYRIIQNQNFQYLINVSYDIIDRWDVPIFTKSPALTNEQWDQKGNHKWKSRIDNIYIYMTINPAKKPGHKLLKPIEEKQKEQLQSHYNSLIEYSRKSDMSLSNQYIHMYQEFTYKSTYLFGETSQIELENLSEPQSKHTSDSNFAKNARDQFVFQFDSKIEAQQKELHEKQQEKNSDKQQQDDNSKEKLANDSETAEKNILSFVKVINTNDNNLIPKGQFFFNANQPINLEQLLQVATDPKTAAELVKSPEKLKKIKIFMDPHSNFCFQKNNLQDCEQVVVHEDLEDYPGEIYEILVEKIQSGPANYIERNGPVFNIHIGSSDYEIQQYAQMVDEMKSRVFADVFQINDNNKQTHMTNWEQTPMDIIEFSLRDNYDEVAQKICEAYNARVTGQYQQYKINKDMIQFFDKNYYEVTFQEYINKDEFKKEGFYENIVTKPMCCLNFRVLAPQLRFNQVDQRSHIVFQLKDHDSVLPQVNDCIVERLDKLQTFRKRVQRELEIQTYVLTLVIDRASGFIKSCAPDAEFMSLFVNRSGYGHAIEKNTDLLRLQILSDQELDLCQRISKKQNATLAFATIKLYNQYRQQLFCSGHRAEQLLVPFCSESHTFSYLLKRINEKVHEVLQRESNQIDAMIAEELPVFLIEFKGRQTKMKSGRISQSSQGLFYSNATFDAQVQLSKHANFNIAQSINNEHLEPSSFPLYNFAVLVHQNFNNQYNSNITSSQRQEGANEAVMNVSPKVSESGRSTKEEKQ